jgi:hypothetical protein
MELIYVGVDISKDRLDYQIEGQPAARILNTAAGINSLLRAELVEGPWLHL